MKRSSVALAVCTLLFAGFGAQARSQNVPVAASPAPSPAWQPHYHYLPDEDDWKPLCDPRNRGADPFDPIKCVRLSAADPNKYLSFGADVRLRYEHYFNKQWNSLLWSNGYLLQRELALVDLHEDRVRAVLQLEHANQLGAHPPDDLTWTDQFATTMAYLEYDLGGETGSQTPPLAIRAGRQQLYYGSGRMIDNRSGLNTIQPFDGFRARFSSDGWRTDLFWVRPVNVQPNGFDNVVDRTRSLFGTYATHAIDGGSLDLYGFVDQRQSQFAWRGSEPEVRWTIGSRYAASGPHVDADAEADYQFGSFGGAAIEALAVETNVGYSWSRGLGRYRVGLGGGYATGDHDPKSARFTEFQPPYPTGLTFGIVEANGVINTAGFTPNFSYTYRNRYTATIKDYVYYRQSVLDGLYAPANIPLRPPAGSDAAPIGNLGFVALSDQMDRHTSLSVAYARYLIGPFLEESGPAPGVPSANTTYYSAALEFKI